MIFGIGVAALASALLAASAATAEPSQAAPGEAPLPQPAEVSAPPQDAGVLIPAKTVIEVAIGEALSSKTNKIGDTFALSLAEPLVIDGRPVLPAGVAGRGEVTHAAKSGWGGKAGELIINARYLECGALRIPLGYFHHGRTGKDNFGGAFVAAQVIPLGQFMVSGGEAAFPVGARGTAKVKSDLRIPGDAMTQCKPPAK